MLLHDLVKKKKITPPDWLPSNCVYLTITGSNAYGVSTDSSDYDCYGLAIPPRKVIFPHEAGYLVGFDKDVPKFDQWLQHGIVDENALGGRGREYDLQVFNIVKFFRLCADGNPNCIDILYTPRECVLHSTKCGELIRENRDKFLSKACHPRFKGYAYSQLSKMKSQTRVGKRKEVVDKIGFDPKFAYHTVRLLLQIEQILTEGTLDLRRNSEILKSIRRHEWSLEKIQTFFDDKERQLDILYHKSDLPWGPDDKYLKSLLLQCLEIHYGELDLPKTDRYEQCLENIRKELCSVGVQ